ncbi:MAG: hypothetical protein M3R06_05345 [Chloroflexota bacterium]|nr:hypothetical protein [Chloroflexota bacterium]
MSAPENWQDIDEAKVGELARGAGLEITPDRLLALTAQVRALGVVIADLTTVDCAGITPGSGFEPRDAWRPTPTTQVDDR